MTAHYLKQRKVFHNTLFVDASPDEEEDLTIAVGKRHSYFLPVSVMCE